jgi:hypothetical protein
MVLVEHLTPVARMLVKAAKAKSTVSFSVFHDLFDEDIKHGDRYDTLEAASRALAMTSIAIYGAVLSKTGTGCPGTGFFDTFKINHPDEYDELAFGVEILDLDLSQMRELTRRERSRVYGHAQTYF